MKPKKAIKPNNLCISLVVRPFILSLVIYSRLYVDTLLLCLDWLLETNRIIHTEIFLLEIQTKIETLDLKLWVFSFTSTCFVVNVLLPYHSQRTPKHLCQLEAHTYRAMVFITAMINQPRDWIQLSNSIFSKEKPVNKNALHKIT